MGVAFVQGLQGNDPKYLKVAATAKHFAVHSGPEADRHHFDARPSERDLYETYLPAFQALVQEAKVESVMGAYNRVNGESASASPRLLQDILRKDWGFAGHVVSDCGAIEDIYKNHKIVKTVEEAAARRHQERVRPRVRQGEQGAREVGRAGARHREGARRRAGAALPVALPARPVRPARARGVRAHSVRGQRVGRERRARAADGPGGDRAAEERRAAAAVRRRRSRRSRSSVPTRTTR